jgi:lipopolysaccharide transport system ATP-binding protein
MSSEPRVLVENLSKCYQVFSNPPDRLKQAIVPRLRRLLSPLLKLLQIDVQGKQYFREFWALHDVSFEVLPGETVGIIGRNGAGKSTLLQLVCGTLTPSSGSVKIEGRVAALLELGAGFNPEFTGRENVYLNASVLGLTQSEIDSKLNDILEFADISEFVDQPIKTYSSGMAMRLAFAVIAHVDADILIVDEALAVGDAYFQQKCMRWLRKFREKGTVLFCAHDTGAVMNLCNKAIWLDGGAVRAAGDAKSVCEEYLASLHTQTSGGASRGSDRQRWGGARQATKALVDAEAKVPVDPASGSDESNESRTTAATATQTISTFEFNEDSASFGTGDAKIISVSMTRKDGSDLGLVEGGEDVQVTVLIETKVDVDNPIIGFHIKDRLGQAIIGDNTYIALREQKIEIPGNTILKVSFLFELPCLKSGEYALTAAIASGTIDTHVQHHWLHDALIFTIHSPFKNGVMVAVPMLDISVATLNEDSSPMHTWKMTA